MKLSEQQQKFALDVAKLIIYMYQMGYACTFGDAYRSPEQAEINVKKGIGIKDSLHCKRLAIDINLFRDNEYLSKTEDYAFLGDFWESLDEKNRWGGRFKDGNHFESTL